MIETPSLFILGSFVVACSAKVKSFPEAGECAFADSFTMEAGGKGFNLAVGAHRLGARVDGLFAIGYDALGAMANAAFARAGLSATMLRRYPAQTGSGIAFIDAAGESRVAVYPGANILLSVEAVREARGQIERSAVVMAQFEIADAPILEAFTIARRAGALTILNPSPFRLPSPALLRQTTIVIVNENEGAALFDGLGRTAIPGRRPEDLLFEAGPAIAIVTLGGRGARLLRRDADPLFQPAFPVATIDTLGAGDAFAAAFAVGLAENRPLESIFQRATASGALATTRLGVFDALTDHLALEAFLKTTQKPQA